MLGRALTSASLAAATCLLSAAVLAGCSSPAEQAQAPPPSDFAGAEPTAGSAPASVLADTEWRLVSFQSMDDAQGTTRPDDPSLYTLRLSSDGTASMRLSCNRADGTWSVEPSVDPANGSFRVAYLTKTSLSRTH